MHHRLVAQSRQCVGEFDRMHHATARVGGMRQYRDPQPPRLGHATAPMVALARGAAPINGRSAKSQIVSEVMPSLMDTRLPCATVPIAAAAMSRAAKRAMVSATCQGFTDRM